MERIRDRDVGFTVELARAALLVDHESLPETVRRIAQDCLLDWLGCTIAGVSEPASQIVSQMAMDEGGAPQATLIGHAKRVSPAQAALANGTASHALDYDDVNLALPGHVSVAIIPALIALAESRRATAADFYAAFVAGYEFACRVGRLLAPTHYAQGFHATATIGSLGAAMACSHMLGLSARQTSHAIGVAATQAAGLKAMFGSMAKPLHAGLAAQAGMRSALLAEKGFIARPDALECAGGFAQAHGHDFHIDRALEKVEGGFYLLSNIFKFHAACFSTHSTISAVAALCRGHEIDANSIDRIMVVAPQACEICNLQAPSTALEAKFSLRAAAAFAALDMDTGALNTWERVSDIRVQALLNRVRVELRPGTSLCESVVTISTTEGLAVQQATDAGSPMPDKEAQSHLVQKKFLSLSTPALGVARARQALDRILASGGSQRFSDFLHECIG